jgi:hypothetical protein
MSRILNKEKYLKKLEDRKKKKRRRVKKFLDFRKSNNKPTKFMSIASSPIPGPMSVGSGTSPIDIVSNTSN